MTTEPISDERLAEIRAGLEGVTGGPWSSFNLDLSNKVMHQRVGPFLIKNVVSEADARHIARLDPQTVAAILSRLDKAEAGWRDISTAPKDGRKVLIWLEDGEWSRHETARWWNDEWILDQDARGGNRKVKLWTPLLPPPPSSES